MKDLIGEIRKALGDSNKALADKLEAAADTAVTELDTAKQEAVAATKAKTLADKAVTKLTADLEAKTKGEGDELAKLRADNAKLTADLETAGGETSKVKLSYAMREAAGKAGMRDPDALAMLDTSGVTLGDDGKLVGFDRAAKGWKAAKPYLFDEAGGTGGKDDGGKGPGAGDRGGKGAGGGNGEPTAADQARDMLIRHGVVKAAQQQQGQSAQQ